MVTTDQIHREKDEFAPLPETPWCLPSPSRCAGKSQIHPGTTRTQGCPHEGHNPLLCWKRSLFGFHVKCCLCRTKTSRFQSRGVHQPRELMWHGKHVFCSVPGAAWSLTHQRGAHWVQDHLAAPTMKKISCCSPLFTGFHDQVCQQKRREAVRCKWEGIRRISGEQTDFHNAC